MCMLVRLEGLEARADITGCIGVLLGVVAESGRAPVRLVSTLGGSSKCAAPGEASQHARRGLC